MYFWKVWPQACCDMVESTTEARSADLLMDDGVSQQLRLLHSVCSPPPLDSTKAGVNAGPSAVNQSLGGCCNRKSFPASLFGQFLNRTDKRPFV